MNPEILADIFSTVIGTSWRASCLILLLVALRRLVRGRIPAQIWFITWLVVALRFLLPFSFPVAWSPFGLIARPANLPASTTAAPPARSDALPEPAAIPDLTVPALEQTTSAPVSLAAPPPIAPARAWSREAWLGCIWIAGVGLLVLARLGGAWRFRRELRHAPSVKDARVHAIAARELARLGIRATVACLETRSVNAPAMFGFRRLRLLFPPGLAANLSEEELRLVIRHELAHWRRQDLGALTVMQAAVVLHWFNPLAWLAARLARADCELACDEFVLRRESAGGAHAYGEALLKVLGMTAPRHRRVAVVVGILEDRHQLAERVRMIARYQAPNALRVCGGLLLIAVLLVASLTREAHAQIKPALTADSAVVRDAPASLPLPASTALPAQLPTESAAAAITAAPVVSGAVVRNAPAKLADDRANSSLAVQPASAIPPDKAAPALAYTRADIESQRRLVEQHAKDLREFKERNELGSLDRRKDAMNQSLRVATAEHERARAAFVKIDTLLTQIKNHRARGADLTELAPIANQPLVAQLKQQLAAHAIKQAAVGEKFRAQHPEMIALTRERAQIEKELERAVASACAQVEVEYQAVQSQFHQATHEMTQRNEESLRLDRLAMDYNARERALQTQEQLLGALLVRATELSPPKSIATPEHPRRSEGEFSVSVIGAVNQQGAMVFLAQDKPIVLDAVARAGGFSREASPEGIRIIRLNSDGKRTSLQLTRDEVMAGTQENVLIRAGDVIVVPEREPDVPRFVTIVGAVNNPGRIAFPLNGKFSIVDLVAAAGGHSRLADLKKVRLTRVDSKTGETTVIMDLNVNDMMRGGKPDVPLKAGDLVLVPEKIL